VALEQLIERVKGMDGMWVTTLEQIAEHTKATVSELHTHARIDVPVAPGFGARFKPGRVQVPALS
jgi:hypothetical protein